MVDPNLLKSDLKRRLNPVMTNFAARQKNDHSMKSVLPSRFRRMGVVTCFILCGFCCGADAQGQPPPIQLSEADMAQVKLDAMTDTERLIFTTVTESNPTTGEELAKAVSVLMDIELYEDARKYLAQLDALGLDETKLFELNQNMGSDFFLMIHTADQVQPEGKTLARKVLAAANNVGKSPARIRQLITTLNDPNISVRSEAFRKLRRLGEPAVAEMLNAFADPDRKSDYPGIRGGLKLMGVNAQGPLLGAAYAADSQVQAEAIRALGSYQSLEASDALMRAYLSPKVPEYLRRIALDSITRGGKSPADPTTVEQRLYDRSTEYLLGTRNYSDALLGTVNLWTWDAANKQLVAAEVSIDNASRVIASRRAADLYEIRPELARNREIYVLTQLEAAKRMAGPSQKVDAAKLIDHLATNAQELDKTLEKALEMELVPAAIACCEMLGGAGDGSLLSATSEKPSSLINAILFGDRYLQFAALEAIETLDPQRAFVGSSYVATLAVHLAKSRNRPAGLVGHNRADQGQTLAALLANSGVVGQAVTSSRDFFDQATSNPDIEMLLVSDTMANPQYAELIQQLRNDWRTKRLPIAFLYRDLERSKRVSFRVRNQDRFFQVPFSVNPELVANNVARLKEMHDPWRLTSLDRRRHAALAIRWLEKVSGERANYPFYDLGSQQDALASILYTPGFAESGSKILASLGTPKAQRELINFASQSGYPIEDREKVVQAFAKSVKLGGTLLTTREIQQQYDRYNASKTEPEETQKILGSILDVLEANKSATD